MNPSQSQKATSPSASPSSQKSSSDLYRWKSPTGTFEWFLSDAKNGIWALRFDLPNEKVNKLSQAVMADFKLLLDELDLAQKASSPSAQMEWKGKPIHAAILFSGKPSNFIAGADIEMIAATQSAEEAESLSREGQKLLNRWEDLPFPTVAAIHGAALGGGCEFALGCTSLVMSTDSSSKIGLPEVMLGVLPGMGGCVRLPRKVGLAQALDLILNSKSLNAERAYKMGWIDAVIQKENFFSSVESWTLKNLEALRKKQRLARTPQLGGVGGSIGSLLEGTSPGRALILKKAKDAVMKKTQGHYPAPLEVIQIMADHSARYGEKLQGDARDRALLREAQGFGRMAATEVSRNLIRLYFLTEKVKKSQGQSEGSDSRAPVLDLQPTTSAGVLGAGVMGGGIAQLFADRKIEVRMKDIQLTSLQAGIQAASQIFQKQVKKKRITPRQSLQRLSWITPTLSFEGFKKTQVVVEAVVENLEVKKKVLKELESEVSDQTVLASNTSSLSITEIQKALARPEQFAGMHFFNPVSQMPLIEIIRGAKSSDRAVSTLYQLAKQIGKTPIVVRDSPGFLVNRLLAPYLNEASYLFCEGVSPQRLDHVLVQFGMPMGPMTLIDEVGIDVGAKVAQILFQAFGDRMTPAPANQKWVEAGRLGKKVQKGIYTYKKEGSKWVQELDSDVYSWAGVTPGNAKIEDEEILDRCVLPMINEASRCLEEKVVQSPGEVDLGMIMGTGFPPFRGGLLRYADHLGVDEVVKRLKRLETQVSPRFAPSPALLQLQASGRAFYSGQEK